MPPIPRDAILGVELHGSVRCDDDLGRAESKSTRVISTVPTVMRGNEDVHPCELRAKSCIAEKELPPRALKVPRKDSMYAAVVQKRDEAQIVHVECVRIGDAPQRDHRAWRD